MIFNKEASDRYYELMTSLGVGISIPKRVTSDPGSEFCCEFAAKLIRGPHNVGPLPLGAVFEGGRHSLFTLWDALRDRVPELNGTLTEFHEILVHGPDFGHSFPLAKASVYEELATL